MHRSAFKARSRGILYSATGWLDEVMVSDAALARGLRRNFVREVSNTVAPMSKLLTALNAWIARYRPSKEVLARAKWTRWLGDRLLSPYIWRWSRRRVALGAAIGVFFGFLIPIGQIPLSVSAAVLLRAHLPSAAIATLITNPITMAPVYVAATYLGAWFTAMEDQAEAVVSWASTGVHLLFGLGVFAVLGAVLAFVIVHLVWRGRVAAKYRQRRAQQRAGDPATR